MSRQSKSTATIRGVVERKRDDLPRFVVLPSAALEFLRLVGTTTVEMSINQMAMSRRTIRQWDRDRWFVSITAEDCRKASIDTGHEVEIELRPVSSELPVELEELIRRDEVAADCWNGLSASRRRMVRDHVSSAKQAATRRRRARQALLRK